MSADADKKKMFWMQRMLALDGYKERSSDDNVNDLLRKDDRIAALEAELGALKETASGSTAGILQVMKERDDALAKVRELEQSKQDWLDEALESRIEKDQLRAERDTLKADNERLRAALVEIRELGEKFVNDAVMDWDGVQDIVKEALK